MLRRSKRVVLKVQYQYKSSDQQIASDGRAARRAGDERDIGQPVQINNVTTDKQKL